jgi:glycosyltransferase involved in cell wall biosynthesis
MLLLKEEAKDDDTSRAVNNLVSVIVPTMNSGKTLHKCLESIRSQRYGDIEIIVIDGHSSDNTTEIASKFNAKIHVTTGERTRAKNFGISESTGEFLFFVDSDMILQPAVVSECVSICLYDKKVAGVIIPERSVGSGFWAKVVDFEKTLYTGSKIESARFFRKSFVVQVGGFDEEIIFYEESTLHQKLEMQGLIVNKRTNSIILHDEDQFSLRKLLRKKRYYSSNAELYCIKYPKYAKIQTKMYYRFLILTNNCNWKKLILHPMLTIGLLVLKTLEFFASRTWYPAHRKSAEIKDSN